MCNLTVTDADYSILIDELDAKILLNELDTDIYIEDYCQAGENDMFPYVFPYILM